MAASPKRTPDLAVPPRQSGVPTKSRGVAASAEVAVIPRSTPAGDLGEASPAGRTWTIELPAGMALLNANDRSNHWGRRQHLTKPLRQTAGWLAKAQQIPRLQRAHVWQEYP